MSFYAKLALASVAIVALTLAAFTLSTSAFNLIPPMEWRNVNVTIAGRNVTVHVKDAVVVLEPGAGSRVYDNAWCRIRVEKRGSTIIVSRSVPERLSLLEWLVCDNARAVLGVEGRVESLRIIAESGVARVQGVDAGELRVESVAGVIRVDASVARNAVIVDNAGVVKAVLRVGSNVNITVKNGSGVVKVELNTTGVNIVGLTSSAGVLHVDCQRANAPRLALENSAGVLTVECRG